MPDQIQFRRVGEEQTAIYLNGKFVSVGSTYLADEWLYQRLGVEIVDDCKGICMTGPRDCLPTLEQVEAAEDDRASRAARAEALRRQADALEAGQDA